MPLAEGYENPTDLCMGKDTHSDFSELQNISRCVDTALRADHPEQAQTRTKCHEEER